MDEKELEEQIFEEADADHNSRIDRHEMKELLNSLNREPNDIEVDLFLGAFDKDHDGTIDRKEFEDMLKEAEATGGDPLELAFEFMDKNGDHFVSEDEFRKALLTIGEDPKVIEEYIKAAYADALKQACLKKEKIDKRGLTFDQFVRIFNHVQSNVAADRQEDA